jgi:AcrR family transcriptional regulator
MSVEIRFQINEKLYIRDPQDSRLGRSILNKGILLLDELGLEEFTFKKLAAEIQSTEASIYRYFENKHLFLTYMLSWYWERVRYKIAISTKNIENPKEKLSIALHTLVDSSREDRAVEYIDESVLFRIILTEGTKAYHSKLVDEENRKGFFLVYKALAADLATIIKAIKPDFQYPLALSSTLLEMANFHIYASQHLPSLTEVRTPEDNLSQVKKLLEHFAFGLIAPKE